MTEKSPARPKGVPPGAVWVADDQEWEVGKQTTDGKKTGTHKYFRADGTLCNECVYVAGEPHGPFKRFHENGEVSQEGAFERGKLHGTQRWFGCDAPTTERSRQEGMSENVWRSEMDWDHGRALASRHYDREGCQINPLNGEPVPERPAGLPPEAFFHDDENVWRLSTNDENNQVDGLVRSWSTDGTLLEEGQCRAGVRVGRWRTFHANGNLQREEQRDDSGERTDVSLVHDEDGRLISATTFAGDLRNGPHDEVVIGRGFANPEVAVQRGTYDSDRPVGVWSYLSSAGAELERIDFGPRKVEAALLDSPTFADEALAGEVWATRVKALVGERELAQALSAAARALGNGETGAWKTLHRRLTAPVSEALARELIEASVEEAGGDLAALIAGLQKGAFPPPLLQSMAIKLAQLGRLHAAHDFVRAALALAGEGETQNLTSLHDKIEAHLAQLAKERAEKADRAARAAKSGKATIEAVQAAIESGSVDAVRKLIAKGLPDPDATGGTALHHAAASGKLDILELILATGTPVDAANAAGLTPLHVAAEVGSAEVVEALVAAGATVDAGDANGLTPLHQAALGNAVEAARALLDAHADPNRGNVQKQRPLHYAAAKGAAETLALLLERGAKVDARDRTQWTALHLAAQEGNPATVQALVDAGANVLRVNDQQQSPLQMALGERHLEAVAILKPLADALVAEMEKPNPLIDAVNEGNEPEVKKLLKARANPNQRGHAGWTPLLVALGNQAAALTALLLKSKADPNLMNDDGISPLSMAARNGSVELVTALLAGGAEVDGRADEESPTPLMHAAGGGHEAAVDALMAAGANPDLRADGDSFLTFAIRGNLVDRVAALLEAGADVNLVGDGDQTPLFYAGTGEMAELLLKHHASVDHRTSEKCTALYLAAETGNLELFKALAAAEADVNAAQHTGQTPLFAASAQGHLEIVEELLRRKADPNRPDETGWGPLHMAAQGDHAEVIAALLGAGADNAAENEDGQTPSDIAEVKHNRAAVAALMG